MITRISFFVAIMILSYIVGRISHVLGGQLNTPHHWIYGAIGLIVGVIFVVSKRSWGWIFIAFGIGFIISDFRDMIDLKFYGPDPAGAKRFWNID